MPAYYIYLISSLPLLNFSVRAPFSLEDFFTKCRDLIPEKEFKVLRNCCSQDEDPPVESSWEILKHWGNFELALRNELVLARAGRKKIDPLKFLRLPYESQPQISHLAMTAYRSSSILEAEKILDQGRWNFLEEQGRGHYFDFEFLLIYGLKLKILQRWENIQSADREKLLSAVVN